MLKHIISYKNQYLLKALKEARKEKKLSQEELAKKVGMPQSHLSKIEAGRVNVTLSNLVEIARTLDHELLLIPRQKISLVNELVSLKDNAEDRIKPAYTLDNEEDSDD